LVVLIKKYSPGPVACLEYDPRSPRVAARLSAAILEQIPSARVEHIGSTSVPGCAGKGIIDLMVLYEPGLLEETKSGLMQLGFQPQSTRAPFSEDRPMRVGSIDLDEKTYNIHAHVLCRSSDEVGVMRGFREALSRDPALRIAYIAEKKRILSEGIEDSVDYAEKKSVFVQGVLREIGSLKQTAGDNPS
jgi:GrpB-like predicted nucleotidyltransferase (UPF0157 family)